MKQVWKFSFLSPESHQIFNVPRGAKVLSVDLQSNIICIWMLVDPKNLLVEREFRVVGTGWDTDREAHEFVGTVIDGPFVWHVFEVAPLIEDPE